MPKSKKKNLCKVISIRFYPEELALIREKSGRQPLSTFIRDTVLDDVKKRRSVRHATLDEDTKAALLKALNNGRYSQNLNQIAKAINSGESVPPIVLETIPPILEMFQQVYHALIKKKTR